MGNPYRLRIYFRSCNLLRAPLACMAIAETHFCQSGSCRAVCSSIAVSLTLFCPIRWNSDIIVDKKQRIIVLTGFRMRSFNSSAFANNPTLAEAEYIAWTQWELTYAVLASTFPPAQRSFLDLVTYYNSNGNYTEHNPDKDRNFPASESIRMSMLNARGTSAGSTPNGAGFDADDFDDDSSQKIIIMKSQTYEVVTRDAASAIEPVSRGMAIHDRQEMVGRERAPIESKTTTLSWS